MSVRSAQSVTTRFEINVLGSGQINADSLPTGTLYVNGTANAASVTVTNSATGRYKAQVTMPTLAAGDFVALEISATVNGVTNNSKVWEDYCDALQGYVAPGAITDSSFSFTDGVSGPATGFLSRLNQLWRHFFKKSVFNKTSNTKKTYADDTTTVLTTQACSSSATADEVDAAS